MDQLNQPEITITYQHLFQMIDISKRQAPLEACGIIAGLNNKSQKVFQISNSLESPVEFLMNPTEMVKVFWELDEKNWEPLAFFHSHPNSIPIPSTTDLERNYYPNTPHIIIGKMDGDWIAKAFLLSKKNYQEIHLNII